jgi:glycosyltransferase involved in cell wall biosynthesis
VAAAIRELFTDRALAQRLAASGRQTVAEKFSLEQMIENTIRLYRQVLSC